MRVCVTRLTVEDVPIQTEFGTRQPLLAHQPTRWKEGQAVQADQRPFATYIATLQATNTVCSRPTPPVRDNYGTLDCTVDLYKGFFCAL
jgi:hypothetical protein